MEKELIYGKTNEFIQMYKARNQDALISVISGLLCNLEEEKKRRLFGEEFYHDYLSYKNKLEKGELEHFKCFYDKDPKLAKLSDEKKEQHMIKNTESSEDKEGIFKHILIASRLIEDHSLLQGFEEYIRLINKNLFKN